MENKKWNIWQLTGYLIFAVGGLMLAMTALFSIDDYFRPDKDKKVVNKTNIDDIWDKVAKPEVKPTAMAIGRFTVVTGQMPNYYTFLVDTATGQTWRVIGEPNDPASGWQKMSYYNGKYVSLPPSPTGR